MADSGRTGRVDRNRITNPYADFHTGASSSPNGFVVLLVCADPNRVHIYNIDCTCSPFPPQPARRERKATFGVDFSQCLQPFRATFHPTEFDALFIPNAVRRAEPQTAYPGDAAAFARR
jgi:hypothetical protein